MYCLLSQENIGSGEDNYMWDHIENTAEQMTSDLLLIVIYEGYKKVYDY